MSDSENKLAFTSLADFAAAKTGDLPALMSRLPEEGVFYVVNEGVSVSMREATSPDEDNRFTVVIKHKIFEVATVGDGVDPERLKDKVVTQGAVLWPNDIEEAIQYLKGDYKRIGYEPGEDDPMGGVEGQEPGWLDSIVGAYYKLRVKHVRTKSGDTRAYFNWMRLDDDEYESLGVKNPFTADDDASGDSAS